ncbi:hypothetical protein DC522_05955 [Microvirga sp. KLBC 81]|uniref:hypothetical protein n=1 Tax=Microvirga sp. KLBC 81 TaxID=1862707 RepID=UPI000D5211A2|nr:hypothetical protein [Microvirga sp. KLBC 81]PVE25437.1 hypothetical protein DC522_05955 [Microvirga sp. KLBC 81]
MARIPRRFARVGAAADLPTLAAANAYVGPDGEPIWAGGQLRMHDGSTPGGIRLLSAGDVAGLAGLRGSIFGLTMSNNTVDGANDIDIAAGAARDSSNVYDLTLATGITKRLDAAWAAGNNAGGLDTGAKAANTSYHVHLIRRTSDGLVDALFSTSPTTPTMPSGWAARRRIGAVLTDASGNIKQFRQVGGWFHYKGTLVVDHSGVSNGPTPTLRTLSVPAGIKVLADLGGTHNTSSTTGVVFVWITDPDLGAPSTADTYSAIASRNNASINAATYNTLVWTNTARQVYSMDSQASGALIYIAVKGWFDPRDEYL